MKKLKGHKKWITAAYWIAFLMIFLVGPLWLINISDSRTELTIRPNATDGAGLLDYMQKRIIAGHASLYFDSRKIFLAWSKKQGSKNSLKDAGIKDWEWKGPGNIGGRIRSMAVVPNKQNHLLEDLIVGSASGGLWRSIDQGSTWHPVDDFMAALTVSQIVVNPSNPDTMYAATGELLGILTAPGAGIFMSIDRGQTWNQIPSTNNKNFLFVNDICIDPSNPKTIYAALKTEIRSVFYFGQDSFVNFNPLGLLAKSTDAGISWNIIDTASTAIYDIEIDPFDSDHLIYSSWDELYQSVDGGLSFAEITGGTNEIPFFYDRAEIEFANSLPGVIYVSTGLKEGELWRSVDFGSSWLPRDTSTHYLVRQAIWNNLLWVDPLNANQVIAGGVILHKSLSGGQNMLSIHHNDLHVDHHRIVPSTNYSIFNPKVYLANDGGLYSIDNIWTTTIDSAWTSLVNGSLGITQLYSGHSDPYGSKYAGGSQDNGGLIGSGIANWKSPLGGDGIKIIINPSDTNIVYGSVQNNWIFKSTDGGQNFNDQIAIFDFKGFCMNSPSNPDCPGDTTGSHANGYFKVEDNAPFLGALHMDKDSNDILFAGGERLWKSDNAGLTWGLQNGTTNEPWVSTITSKLSDGLIFYGNFNGEIIRSMDGGLSWITVLKDSLSSISVIGDIEINPQNVAEILVSISRIHEVQILYSQDTGTTWQDISLPFAINVNTISWHPTIPNWIYAGTDFGIFASEDLGQNWNVTPIYSLGEGTHSNDGPVFCEVTDLFWQGLGTNDFPYHLCAATYGRGIWRSKDPIVNLVYVDKNCSPCGKGTLAAPYSTLREAVQKTGSGVTIQFLSEMTHDEAGASILITGRKMILPPLNKKIVVE